MFEGIIRLLGLFFSAPYLFLKRTAKELKEVKKDTGKHIMESDLPLLNILMVSGRVFVILMVLLMLLGIFLTLAALVIECIRIAEYSTERAFGKLVIDGAIIFFSGIIGTFFYFWFLGVMFEFLTLSIRAVNYLDDIRKSLNPQLAVSDEKETLTDSGV